MKISIRTIVVILLVIISLFFIGEFAQRYIAYQRAGSISPLLESFRHIVENTYYKFPTPISDKHLENYGLPVYELKVSPKNLKKLRQTAEQVSAATYATGIQREYVPAKFWLDNRWINIKVKLRGYTNLHYRSERPSLKLKFPKNNLFDNKRIINISDPYDKSVAADITTNWELSRYGILTWESQFVVLKINGNVIGLFQEIEQFGRSMIDRQGRPEGYIFSGAGECLGKEGSDQNWKNAIAAVHKFIACYGQGDNAPSTGPCTWEMLHEYVDVDKFAWAAALTTLLGSSHAWWDDNIRLYYDPVRGQLEPIPWDYSFYSLNYSNFEGESQGEHFDQLGQSLLRLPEFRKLRDERLWELITKRVDYMTLYADRFFQKIETPFKHDNRIPPWRVFITKKQLPLFKWDKALHNLYIDTLKLNAEHLQKCFQQQTIVATIYEEANDQLFMDLSNYGKAFAVISGVEVKNNQAVEQRFFKEPYLVDGLWAEKPGRGIVNINKLLTNPILSGKKIHVTGLIASNGITGDSFAANDRKLTFAKTKRQVTLTALKDTSTIIKTDNFPSNIRTKDQKIILGPGQVNIDNTLIFPKGYSVEFLPGLQLSLSKNSALIVHGDLIGNGTKAKPITIKGTNAGSPWGAIVAKGSRLSPIKVILSHLTMIGGAGYENNRFVYSGSLTVVDGSVTIDHCNFYDNQAIDAINLKYCTVNLQNSSVKRSVDDSVDLDFCQGQVIGNAITNSGGDGFDFSGSELVVENNFINQCKDKGISVGEKTDIKSKNNIILNCQTGIAVKDGSTALIQTTGLSGHRIGISLYRKKLTFGQPNAVAKNIILVDVETPFLKAPGIDFDIVSSFRYVVKKESMPSIKGLTVYEYRKPFSNDELKKNFSAAGIPVALFNSK